MSLRDSLLFARPTRWAFFVALAIGSVLITRGSLLYFSAEDIHPFVLEKLPLPLEDVWLAALRVHVIAAAVSLPACLLMLSRPLLRRLPRVHRVVGRVTGVVVVFALVPTGGYLAFFATGGWLSTLGFLLSGAIILVGMTLAIVRARARDFVAHRRWVLHVVAQMSVAITSRALLVAFGLAQLDPERTYVISLWLPVLLSAWLAERAATRVASRTPLRRQGRFAPHRSGDTMKPLVRVASAPMLITCLLSMPVIAAPAEGAAGEDVRVAIQQRLVKPLQKHEARRSRFSRARRPPADRRVRILDKTPVLDDRGRAFVSFAVDAKFSRAADGEWIEDDVVGCFYPKDGAIYIKRGDAFRSSSILLGKKAKSPPRSVCRASSLQINASAAAGATAKVAVL